MNLADFSVNFYELLKKLYTYLCSSHSATTLKISRILEGISEVRPFTCNGILKVKGFIEGHILFYYVKKINFYTIRNLLMVFMVFIQGNVSRRITSKKCL